MDHFYSHQDSGVTAPSQVAIVGDRLLTDMIMANIMGAYGIWTRDGVAEAMQRPSLVRYIPTTKVVLLIQGLIGSSLREELSIVPTTEGLRSALPSQPV